MWKKNKQESCKQWEDAHLWLGYAPENQAMGKKYNKCVIIQRYECTHYCFVFFNNGQKNGITDRRTRAKLNAWCQFTVRRVMSLTLCISWQLALPFCMEFQWRVLKYRRRYQTALLTTTQTWAVLITIPIFFSFVKKQTLVKKYKT